MVAMQATTGKVVHTLYTAPSGCAGAGVWGSPAVDTSTGDISSSAWDGTRLYVGGGNATIRGISCRGSVEALQPGNGKIIWRNCLTGGPVIAAVTAVPGVVFLGEGAFIKAFGATTGNALFSYQDSNSGSDFWGPASIVGGTAYIGNQDGSLFALSP